MGEKPKTVPVARHIKTPDRTVEESMRMARALCQVQSLAGYIR